MSISERRIDMSLYTQARRLGFIVTGDLTPVEGRDSRCRYFEDEAGNIYIVRYGILTIVAADGKVY
jgi:hypothetical protein